MNIHNALFVDLISTHGTDEQKNHYFPTYVNGDQIGSFALSEPCTPTLYNFLDLRFPSTLR